MDGFFFLKVVKLMMKMIILQLLHFKCIKCIILINNHFDRNSPVSLKVGAGVEDNGYRAVACQRLFNGGRGAGAGRD